jgi:hypothetical protein
MIEKVNGKIGESEEDSTREGLKAEREVVVKGTVSRDESKLKNQKSNQYFLYRR